MKIKILQLKRGLRAALLSLLLLMAGLGESLAQTETHEYVDLGLPSGTLWATCNVGANSPEEYGDYFSWGETQPKGTYNWSNYQYCNGSQYTLTKYCNNSGWGYNCFTDTLTVLLPEDDAATANWGTDWRMPTKEEWEELLDNTTNTWATLNGVNGRLFTASNGNSLFLPATGCILNDEFVFIDDCNYWSSSLCTDNRPDNAWEIFFQSDGYGMQGSRRGYYGESVRPVRSTGPQTHSYIDLGLPSGTLWATCNVGATSPEEYGDYFSWGETQPKDTYNWGNYQYCNGSQYTLTKYCNNSGWGYNGFTDTLTVLLPEDDAATANWGTDWRTPTKEEWEELLDNTTNTWTTQNGVNGRLFTASNGNSLFLPATGCILNDEFVFIDDCNYWSSSLCTDNTPEKAWEIFFRSDGYGMQGSRRGYYGESVRPVRATSQGFTNHWTPNTTDYEENMPVTAVVEIDGVEQQSITLELGAFCGEECRGSKMATYFEPTQRYIYQMTVFGEEGDEIAFRLYDHATNEEFDLTAPEAITFDALVHGTQPNPVVLNFRHSYEITATADPAEGGTVNGGGTYLHGETCTLTATPNEGYSFVNWTKDGQEVSTEATYSFTVTEDASFVANFISEGYYWDVNIYQYPNTMSVIGIIQIDGVEQATAALELGAFVNDECRGRERLEYDSDIDRYLLYLTLFGNDDDQLTFKLYDHGINAEVDKTCLTTLTFETNGVVGTYDEPFVFDFGDALMQTSSFVDGWTWWSTYIEQSDLNGLAMLEDELGTNGLTIKSQSQFVNYNPNTNKWTGSLKSINNEGAFMIRASVACEVNLTGTPVNPADHPITLNPGWTWIGYPVTETMSVTEAFSNITPSVGDQVKSQSGFATYNGTKWSGSLKNMEPGKGYMYKSNSSQTVILVYPNGAGE